MERPNLWAPWRMQYIQTLAEDDQVAVTASTGCFLCDAASAAVDSDDAKQRLMLLNDARGIVLLNRFPYTNGHLLVACHDHLGDLGELSAPQRNSLMELTALAERLLRAAVNPQGINIGINLGRCAGAGLPGHLHVHVVPRWNGDVNFMQTVGQVRVMPQALEESHAHLAATLATL